jgi:hypothetical protein
MKRLRGTGVGRLKDEDGKFECDEIVLELDHSRTIRLRRKTLAGEDGIELIAGIDREDRTANARFVLRVPNFGQVHLSVEQAK